MAELVPEILYSYLMLFRPHFNKPSFVYFSGYMVSLLLTGGRKTMSRVAHTCFFVDCHLASWERFLAENAGRVFSREKLLDTIWGIDVAVETRTVDVHVRRLREKL